ncbi:hypothetical protein M422DRAFT_26402 [Sphaerobolus stellatus SS14]|nr:hypothetical protein M422DRAFT_26402 [Sphaerobolus stellatus SS14]
MACAEALHISPPLFYLVSSIMPSTGPPTSPKRCHSCQSHSNVQLCKGCHNIYYCNPDCQRADIRHHRPLCRYLSSIRTALRCIDRPASKVFGQACRWSALIQDLAISALTKDVWQHPGVMLQINFDLDVPDTVNLDLSLQAVTEMENTARAVCMASVPPAIHFIIVRMVIGNHAVSRPVFLDGEPEEDHSTEEELQQRIILQVRRLCTLKKYHACNVRFFIRCP